MTIEYHIRVIEPSKTYIDAGDRGEKEYESWFP